MILAVYQVHPGGQDVGIRHVHLAQGVLLKGHAVEDAVLGVACGGGGNEARALVGNRVAHGIEHHGFVLRVGGAGEQVHGLDHVGMAAHHHVKAQVTELLGHGHMGCGLGQGVFLGAPVDLDHGGLGPCRLHLGNILLQLRVHLLGVRGHIAVDMAVAQAHHGVAVHAGVGAGAVGGLVGVADDAHLDAADVLDDILGLLGSGHGADDVKALAPGHFDGTQEAVGGGVEAVVVGGHEHVEACVFQGVVNFIGTVEEGIALVGLCRACRGGFQVRHGQVGAFHIVLDEAEHIVIIIGAVLLKTRADKLDVHEHVSRGEDGAPIHHFRRRGLRRCGGLRGGGSLGGVPGGNGHIGTILDRGPGGIQCEIHAQKHHQPRQGNENDNEYGQQGLSPGIFASSVSLGHFVSPFLFQ